MKVNYGRAIEEGWAFAIKPENLTAYFLIFLAELVIMLIPVLYLLTSLTTFISGMVALNSPIGFASMATAGVGFLAAIIVVILIDTFAMGLFIRKFAAKTTLSKSAAAVKRVYLRLLATVIVVSVISIIVSLVPILGVILAIIVALVFYFVYQQVVIAGKNIGDAISGSWDFFQKYWGKTIITFVLVAIISAIIIIISAIPMIAILLGLVGSAITKGFSMALMQSNMIGIAISGLILVLGFAVSKLFTLGAQTSVFMQLTGKKKK